LYKFKASVAGKTKEKIVVAPKPLNKTASKIIGNLSAKIKSISPYGTIVVKFSEPLEPLKVTNYSLIIN
jgi:hypothetical protein